MPLWIYEFHTNRCREGRDFLADVNGTTFTRVPWRRAVFRRVKNGFVGSALRHTVRLSQSCPVFHRTRYLILDTLTVVFRPDDYRCTVVNTSCCFLSTHLMFDWPPDKRLSITYATKINEINKDNQQSPNKPSRFTRVLRPWINIVSGLEPTAMFSRTRAVIVLGRTSVLSLIHSHTWYPLPDGRKRCLPTLRWISIRYMPFYRVFLLSYPWTWQLSQGPWSGTRLEEHCVPLCSLAIPYSTVAYLPS
jgi:hypothetical protein